VPVPLPDGVSYEGVFGGDRSTGTTFSSEFIEGLPILGRNYQEVLTLAPGIPTIHGSRDTNVVRGKAAPRAGGPTGINCRIEARRSYRLGESIEIAVTLENRSSTVIEIPAALAIPDGTARFTVTDASGTVLPDPSDHTAAEATVRLLPGARLTLRVILNGRGGYRLERAGKYRVLFLGASLGACDSNALTLILKP